VQLVGLIKHRGRSMDKTNSVLVLFGSFFITLFFMSLFMPDARIIFNDTQPFVAQMFDRENSFGTEDRAEKRDEEDKREYRENREDDEAEYYRNIPPRDMDDSSFFEKDDSLKEKSLDKDLMR
jgi:hypothetical protein